MFADKLHHARLSVDDLSQIAAGWRVRAEAGDSVAKAIADAMESVVRQRQAAALVRERISTARRAWAPLARAADWAISRW